MQGSRFIKVFCLLECFLRYVVQYNILFHFLYTEAPQAVTKSDLQWVMLKRKNIKDNEYKIEMKMNQKAVKVYMICLF